MFARPNEIAEQRKQARIASLEALQRHLELDAPYKREKQRKALVESAKNSLIEQAGTSAVPKEVLQKLEQSDPIIY
jgi:predicted GIY-YIG superfamily endonuclease